MERRPVHAAPRAAGGEMCALVVEEPIACVPSWTVWRMTSPWRRGPC